MYRKIVLGCATALLLAVASFDAQALPLSHSLSASGPADVTLVAGGCGAGFHRGAGGRCYRDVVVAPVVVAPAPVVVAPAPVVVAPRVCPVGFRMTRRGVCVR